MPQRTRTYARGDVCVVVAGGAGEEGVEDCLRSVREHVEESVAVVHVDATAAEVNRALEQLAGADVVLLDEPCRVSDGWIERLRDAARSDTNTATASALVDVRGALALAEESPAAERRAGKGAAAERSEAEKAIGGEGAAADRADPTVEGLARLAAGLAARTLALRPRLSRAVGPCVYVRREALELVGRLDEGLDLEMALEVDFAQRCLLSGLAHVAADDVVVQRLAPARSPERTAPVEGGASGKRSADELPRQLLQRYPYLADAPTLAESGVLAHALRAARGPSSPLWVTLDARALDGAATGTQVHVLELILALARTGALRLRLLVWAERIDRETLELLRGLPETEVLAAEEVDGDTPRSEVFHRPQQAFSPGDVAFAIALGERIVLSQLDLIAYRNPGYFADADAWEDFRRASRHGLAAAERVVVFSEHTRRELLADALVEAERVRVVPPGLDHRAAGEPRRPAALDDDAGDSSDAGGSAGDASSSTSQAGGSTSASNNGGTLENGFLLCLGTDFRHKNRLFALRLLAALRSEHDWRGRLVLAGTHIPHGSSPELARGFLKEHGELRGAVVELGAVDEEEKAWLIAHAGAVVYPSVYEGFGLVPFESALDGTPCVFAPQSSLAEAAPEGTATIVPWDPVSSAAAVRPLLADGEARARHVQALSAAAHELTWTKAAASMVEVYGEAAAAPVRDAATLSRDAVARELGLTAAHQATVRTLIDERERVLRDYEELIAAVGPARSLIGPEGALPEDLQRGLLALSARPTMSRPLYGGLARLYATVRALGRALRALYPA
jgi:glycosyltransferase involved in cell wall biosynthesis